MLQQTTLKKALQDKREGKAASTQAGEFIREEMHHIREGKYGARSTKQAIAIGLSKARRAGVELSPPRKGMFSESIRKKARRDYEKRRSSFDRSQSARKAARTQARIKA